MISNASVNIETLQNLTLGAGTDSLIGTEGQTVQLYLTAIFSDQTVYINFIPEATTLFPSLVSLSSNTPTAATVNSMSGQVTLQGNYHSLVAITASTRSGNLVQTQVSFACNLEPVVGDVDLGFPSGVPLPAVQVGETVTVPIRINTGSQSLMVFDLAVAYSTNHLRFLSLSRGADWLGSLQHTDMASLGLVAIRGSFSGAGASGIVHLASLSFTAHATGTADFTGLVQQLLDTSGSTVGGGSFPRGIVAGKVSLLIAAGRRRREASFRTRRNTACPSPPPCVLCPSIRETGDVNGDCVFDGSDSLFLLQYHAEELFDFQLPSGAMLLESLIPEQQTQFDADQNTAVDPSDALFLLQAGQGLLNFLSNIAVTPIQDSSTCTLSINTTLLSRGDPANAQSTVVYFDIALSFGPTLPITLINQQRFDNSVVLLGDAVQGVNKGLTLPGGVLQASPLVPGVFGIELQTNLTLMDIGVSVIQVTSPDSRTTSPAHPARTRAMFGHPNPPYAYPYPLNIDLPNSATVLASYGYNPLTSFNNTLTTTACSTPPPPPVFSQTRYTGEIAEDSAIDSAVLNVSAESQSGFPVAFLIGGGDSDGTFTVDSTGALILAGTLDFETQALYELVILATDTSSGLSSQASAIVTVTDANDNQPVFPPVSPIHLPQNTPNGSVVATVNATDADSGLNAELEYSIQSDNDTFAVETARGIGIITLQKSLNFDTQSYYEVIVTATDMGAAPLSSSVALNITVLPPDPTVLQFTQSIFNESVVEDTQPGIQVLQLQASPVSNETDIIVIRYSIDSPPGSPFGIQADSGLLVVNGSLDREIVNSYELQVSAVVTNTPRAVPAMAIVFVSVLDLNDNAPEFVDSSYTATLLENSPPGTLNLLVSAVDPDSGSNGTVQYSLLETSSSLSINGATGVLTNLQPFDYEAVQQLQLTVVARDMGSPALVNSVNVTIDITDVNDNPPSISVTPSAVNITESAVVGTLVAVASATDRDSSVVNGELIFSLSSNIPEFSINSSSGEITMATTLDFEMVQSYEVIVTASDSGDPPLSSRVNISVQVLDANDNPPIFSRETYSVNVSESTPVGETLLQLEASDSDSGLNALIEFALISGPPTFNLSAEGALILATPLDFETNASYTLLVTAFNPALFVDPAVATIAVTVTDVNEFPPVFAQNEYSGSVVEASLRAFVVQVAASDVDGTTNITYSITAGGGVAMAFLIEPDGAIFTAQSLDRESVPRYNLTVVATDNREPDMTSAVVVMVTVLDINDNQPLIGPFQNLSVVDSTPVGTLLAAFIATDPDRGDNGTVVFSIADEAIDFNVSQSGQLRIASELNAITMSRYSLTIIAQDLGVPPLSSTAALTIEVQPSPLPVFEQALYSMSIAENIPPNAFLVQLRAQARDPTVSISYRLGTELGDVFAVEPSSGNVTTLVPLDREQQGVYSLTVEALVEVNATILSATATVIVTVLDENDNPPLFTNDAQILLIPETTPSNTTIASLQATDADILDNAVIQFSIVAGNDTLFTIDQDGNVTTLVSLLSRIGEYSFVIQAANPPSVGALSSTVMLNVTIVPVNLFSPIFVGQYNATVREDAPVTTPLLTLVAVDSDLGTAGELLYSITAGNDGTFDLDRTSGSLTLASSLDFEARTVYSLTVTATDLGIPPRSSEVNVYIQVADFNDRPPVFSQASYRASISENLPAGQSVLEVVVTDADSAINSEVTFSIFSGFNTFEITSLGVIRNTEPLDREAVSSYSLEIRASNLGTSILLTATVSVEITILDENDNAPQFSVPAYGRVVQAPVEVNTTIVQVQASDVDEGVNGTVRFSLSDPSGTFVIDPITGEVYVSVEISSEANFTLNVTAFDLGMPSMSTTTTLGVMVLPPDDLTAGREQDFVFTAERGASLIGLPVETAMDTYQHMLGFVVGRSLQEPRSITASLGPLTGSATISPSLLPPSSVQAILLTPDVWHDEPTVKVTAQVRDINHNVQVATSTVYIRIAHPSAGDIQGSCVPSPQSGACIALVSIPEEWFSSRANVAVEYGLSSSSLQNLSTVALEPRPIFNISSSAYVYMEMPFRPLFRRDTFTVSVFGETGAIGVGSYTIRVQSSSAVTLLRLSAGSEWLSRTMAAADGSITITAVRNDQESTPSPGRVQLFVITAQVTASSPIDTLLPVALNSTVLFLGDSDRTRVLPPPAESSTPAHSLSRSGISTSGGEVYVADDRPLGLLPHTTHSELVNTAALNGESIFASITVLGAFRSGRLGTISTASCTSSVPNVVAVTPNCSTILLTEDQTQPSTHGNITVMHMGLTTHLPLRVWVPQFPVMLTARDGILDRVPQWFSATDSCTPRYQHTSLTAFASFTDSETSVDNIDVIELVSTRLVSSDISVLSVEGSIVRGVSPGIASVQAQLMSRTVQVEINVTSASEEVLGLDVQVLTALNLSSPGTVDRLSLNPLTILTEQMFDFEGIEGGVVVSAVFSDGSRTQLRQSDGIVLSSLNEDVIRVSNMTATAIGSGHGELVQATWSSASLCSGEPIATGSGIVSVNLPLPEDISVSVQLSVLTQPGSTASMVGVPSSVPVTVVALYSGDGNQDLTDDPRTVYSAPGGISVTRNGTAVVVVDRSAQAGEYSIRVTFTQFPDLERVLNITVVALEDISLTATPFPTYRGSESYQITALHPIASTGLRQQALMTATAVLDNGETVDISSLPSLLQLTASTPQLQAAASISTQNVLSVSNVALIGTLTVSATVGDITSRRPLDIAVTPTAVQVVSIDITPFPEGNTFRGVVNATRQVVISVQFNDTTQYEDLFATRELPNLVTFTAGPSSALTVDPSTGVITLRGNSLLAPAIISVTATDNVSLVQSLDVFCNLDPRFGDVDLGNPTGTAIATQTAGSDFTLPVRVNSGLAVLDSIELDVTFDPTIIRAISATPGSDWPASLRGAFEFVTNDPDDVISLGGILVGDTQVRGSSLHLADIRFEAFSSGVTNISGTILTLAQVSTGGGFAANIVPVPAEFVAGSIQVLVVSSSGKRRRRNTEVAAMSEHSLSRIRRQLPCTSPPCDCGTARETGDVDGNCVFDVRDASYLQFYYLSSVTSGASSSTLPDDRAQYLDIDLNGDVDPNDVIFMLRVNFRLLRFVTDIVITPVTEQSCELSINVTLLSRGDVPAEGSSTTLVIDFAHEDPAFQAMFDATNFTTGSVLPVRKGPTHYGGLVEADDLGDGVFGVAALTAINITNFGVSPIQVTFDNSGQTSPVRTAAMFSQSTPRYPALTVSIPVRQEVIVQTQRGYSPLNLTNSQLPSQECLLRMLPLAFEASSYATTIPENSIIGTTVQQVRAITYRPNAIVLYSLNSSTSLPFTINNITGDITLSMSVDFERQPSYLFTALATEDGISYASAEVLINISNINDLAPEVTPIGALDVPANRSSGDLIFQVSAQDPDSLDPLIYRFELSDPPGLFSITENTGEITAAVSLLGSANTSVQLNISVSDGAFTSYISASLDIFLPRFTEELYTASIPELSQLGATVLVVVITGTRSEIFNFLSLDPPFAVNESGVVYVAGELDFETQNLYSSSITAHSSNFYIQTQVNVAIIDDNDNRPNFTQPMYSITVPVSTPIGSSLAQFEATDGDSGSNAVIAYSTFPSPQAGFFSLNSATGELTLLQTLLGGPPVINITLVATDTGQPPLNGSAVLMLEVMSFSTVPFPTPPIISTTSGVFPVGEPQRGTTTSTVTFLQQFGKVSGPSGLLTAAYGSTGSSLPLTSAPRPATNSSVFLLYPGGSVYRDGREVTIVVQVRDSDYRTSTDATVIQVEGILSASDSIRSDPCTPDPQYGLCVVNLTLPGSWFDGLTSPTDVLLIPSLNAIIGDPLRLSLQPATSLPTNLVNQVLVKLPSRDVFWGQSFQIDIYGYSTYAISGFSLTFVLDTVLLVEGVSIDSSIWSALTVAEGSTFAISAILATPAVQATLLGNTPTLLFSLLLRPTSPTIDASYSANIGAQVQSIANVLEGNIILSSTNTTSGPALFASREGVSVVGTVRVIPDQLLAVLPWTAQPELINTAVLNGENISAPVELFAGYASGSVVPYSGEVNCTSTSAVRVVTLDPSCRYVTLVGSESEGGDGMEVEFSVGGVTGRLPLRVYYPQLPIMFTTSDTTLNHIQYTLVDNCTVYQQATLSALADFVAGSHQLTNASVTFIVSPVLRSTNESVLVTDGSTVQGLKPGMARVCPSLNETLGCADFVVTDDSAVSVSAVSASILVELTTTTENTSLTSGDIRTVAVDVRSQLQFEQEVATAITTVQYTDGTVSLVDSSEVTLLPSTGPVFAVQAGSIVALSSGEGEVQFVWSPQSSQCVLQVSETARVSVSLPDPIDVRAFLLPPPHNHTLTLPGDPASLAGVPTMLFLQVELVYQAGRTINVTSDPRTVYSPSRNLIAVSSDGIVTTIGQEAGPVQLSITFNHTNLTAMIQFEVVRFAELRLRVFPYPPYPGSDTSEVETLFTIESTGVWQSGSITLSLVLTNNNTIDVTRLNETVVTSMTLVGAVMPAISNSFVLSVQDPGLVELRGMFGSTPSVPLLLTVSNTPVRVASMTVNPLPSNTLRGIAGSSDIQLTVNITFSDGSQYLNFPANPSLPSLPSLITFNTSSPAINISESGLLLPLVNSISLVSVLANAGTVAATTSFVVNLDPDFGDVDLGQLTGPPLPTPLVGANISVPLFVNTGSRSLGSVNIKVTYDPQVLQVVAAGPGPDWEGVQEAVLNDPPGEVRFAGAMTVDGVIGSRLHIFTLMMVQVGSSTSASRLTGTVVTLAERDLEGTPIGAPTPRSFVAGDILLSTSAPVGRRSAADVTPHSVQPAATRWRRATSECPSPPCTCSRSTAGDVDGNCVFDVRDLNYALIYNRESLTNFTRPEGQEILRMTSEAQLRELDPNQDGLIDINDVFFLLRTVLGKLYFLQNVVVTPVQNTNSTCDFTVQVQLTDGGTAGETLTQVEVFVDISFTTANLQSDFDTSTEIFGSLVTGRKSPGLVGGVVQAVRTGSDVFTVQLNASFVDEDIGMSVILATFDASNTTDASRTAQFFGLPPPIYTSPLNLTIPARGSEVFVVATAGYSPLVRTSNTLRSQDCSDDPLIGPELSVTFVSPFQADLEWILLNMRMGIDFTPLIQLYVTNCTVSQNGSTEVGSCEQFAVRVQTNTSHTLTTEPFMDYQFEVRGPTTRSAAVQLRSPEIGTPCDPLTLQWVMYY